MYVAWFARDCIAVCVAGVRNFVELVYMIEERDIARFDRREADDRTM